jgi:hypothetical protein
MRIQKAIQEGHLKFDNKMKLDGHPFPQNMVGFSVNMVTTEEKGKVKVLTSARAKQDGAVDPERQVTLEQVHGEPPRFLKSHVEIGESSRAKPRVTTCILLNKCHVEIGESSSARWKKSATRSENMRRRDAGPKRKHAEEIWSNTRASRSARTGDVRSSGTVGMRV